MVLKERMPAHQKAIKEKAESERLITTTYNLNVKVFTKTNVNFIYFGEKTEIFDRKSWLVGIRNAINGKPMVLKERMPAHQKAIKEKAESERLITTTYNCNVKVFTKTNESYFRSISLNLLRAVRDIKDRAVKKQRFFKVIRGCYT